MADRYNNRIAKMLKRISKVPQDRIFGFTISRNCTLYAEDKSEITAELRKHEDYHKSDIASWQSRKGEIFGWVSWMSTYLWRNLTIGYKENEFEQGARK